MLNINLNDTIAAVATPIGESGIGIVRMSGGKALSIADKIFVSKDGRRPSDFKTYTTHYGWIVENQISKNPCLPAGRKNQKSNVVDEVILTVMRAPKTYTRQDVVEINCHGGIIPLRRILELVLDSGIRLARPGEFTQRAFLNGRIDLTQAEAVLDVVKAKTDAALRVGIEQLKGGLSEKLKQIRNGLLEMLTVFEADIDFPDEDLETVDTGNIIVGLERLEHQLSEMLSNSERGRILREGIKVVICGKPNAGKSSLLNALLKCERSIVTPIAGTTRDTIEDILDIRGIPIRIVDTAGIIEPGDLIERQAVSRSQQCIREADLILLVFDGSRGLSYEDRILMRKAAAKPTLALVNKIDLRQKISYEKISQRFEHIVKISAKKQKNIGLLEAAIAELIFSGKIKSDEKIWVSNLRQIQQLKMVRKSIRRLHKSVRMRLPFEFIAQDLKGAVGFLDEIQGKRLSEDLLDRIFSQFCIGK